MLLRAVKKLTLSTIGIFGNLKSGLPFHLSWGVGEGGDGRGVVLLGKCYDGSHGF